VHCCFGHLVRSYPPPVSRRAFITLLLCLGAAVAAGLVRLSVGPGGLAWPADPDILEIRLARLGAGAAVGACLAVAGVFLQSLLRNPLASPDLLGLASGAGLGIVIAAYVAYAVLGTQADQFGRPTIPQGPRTLPALAGSFAALALIWVLAQRRGRLEPVSLILIGVMVSIMASAASTFVARLMPDTGFAAMRWMLGWIADFTPPAHVAVGLGCAAGGVALGLWLGPAMDAASLSDDEARSVGVRLGLLRTLLFIASGVLTAASVVLAGPIGFVGLVCPHVVRLAAGPHHRPLVAGAAFAGVALVVGADALVRAIWLETGRVPIGVLTALLGGPVFIVLLRRELRTGTM